MVIGYFSRKNDAQDQKDKRKLLSRISQSADVKYALQRRTLKIGYYKYDYDCPMCLDKLSNNSLALMYPCYHGAHLVCALDWATQSASCPVCRKRWKRAQTYK